MGEFLQSMFNEATGRDPVAKVPVRFASTQIDLAAYDAILSLG